MQLGHLVKNKKRGHKSADFVEFMDQMKALFDECGPEWSKRVSLAKNSY